MCVLKLCLAHTLSVELIPEHNSQLFSVFILSLGQLKVVTLLMNEINYL